MDREKSNEIGAKYEALVALMKDRAKSLSIYYHNEEAFINDVTRELSALRCELEYWKVEASRVNRAFWINRH